MCCMASSSMDAEQARRRNRPLPPGALRLKAPTLKAALKCDIMSALHVEKDAAGSASAEACLEMLLRSAAVRARFIKKRLAACNNEQREQVSAWMRYHAVDRWSSGIIPPSAASATLTWRKLAKHLTVVLRANGSDQPPASRPMRQDRQEVQAPRKRPRAGVPSGALLLVSMDLTPAAETRATNAAHRSIEAAATAKPIETSEARPCTGYDSEESNDSVMVLPSTRVELTAVETASAAAVVLEQLTCAICTEIMQEGVCTPCMHRFCKRCIVHWVQTRLRRSCPICRAQLSRRQLRPDEPVRALVKMALEAEGLAPSTRLVYPTGMAVRVGQLPLPSAGALAPLPETDAVGELLGPPSRRKPVVLNPVMRYARMTPPRTRTGVGGGEMLMARMRPHLDESYLVRGSCNGLAEVVLGRGGWALATRAQAYRQIEEGGNADAVKLRHTLAVKASIERWVLLESHVEGIQMSVLGARALAAGMGWQVECGRVERILRSVCESTAIALLGQSYHAPSGRAALEHCARRTGWEASAAIRYVDFGAGAGFFASLVEERWPNFRYLLAVEAVHGCLTAHAAAWSDKTERVILQIEEAVEKALLMEDADLFQFSWPCAAFSKAARVHAALISKADESWAKVERALELLQEGLRYVLAKRPRAVILENVDVFWDAPLLPVLARIETLLRPARTIGYEWDYQIIRPHFHFSDGVSRGRLWITGVLEPRSRSDSRL